MDVFPSGHDQGRTTITVTGDIDLGNAGELLVRLTALIGSARRDIDLDLSGVTFIDCSGLRALTAIDTRVHANGATARLTAKSPVVARLLELANAILDTTVPVATRRTATPGQAAGPRPDCAVAA